MPTTEPETLESLLRDLKRAERKLDKAKIKMLAALGDRDTIRDRIHELTKPGGQ